MSRLVSGAVGCALVGCAGHAAGHAPAVATVVVDRFSAAAGHLMVRGGGADLPAPGAPIDLDRPPFVTQGLSPSGAPVRYYNFDVQSATPAVLYRWVTPGTREPAGVPDTVTVLPGEPGYSDFWRVALVDLPASGPVVDPARLPASAVHLQPQILDCPIVPAGSRAKLGPQPHALAVRGGPATCLLFDVALTPEPDGTTPTSPIFVTFAKSGFRTEDGTPQTHNVVFSVPGDLDYSPLWAVHIYDGSAFGRVHDATSAADAPQVKLGPLVNCPIVTPAQPVH